MSQAHLLLQALYQHTHRPSSTSTNVATLARATSLALADVRQNVRTLAKQRFVEGRTDGAIRLTLAGLAVAVAGIDPQPGPAAVMREARRVAYAA